MGALQRIGGKIAERQEVAVVGMLVLTLAMMVMPMPPMLADVLIAINIGLSVLLMMAAIQISAPIEFSTLPSLILLTTTFRLSLSITTSRMVLVQGDAGEIIRAFGEFVIAGNVVVGLVVYLIITIVQFLVISKGSERVAEVAARFTLDALPGKQISIDTDLKNGDIDKDEARRRRAGLATESQLFGAMDGAMKFVKGDSIASLVIIVINLVGGIVIGSVQRGLSFGEAVRTYSLLAVGDGLIAQIPRAADLAHGRPPGDALGVGIRAQPRPGHRQPDRRPAALAADRRGGLGRAWLCAWLSHHRVLHPRLSRRRGRLGAGAARQARSGAPFRRRGGRCTFRA